MHNQKYFTTRKWGFGSNIVNFIKTAIYCKCNNASLFLQDRYNTIGGGYELFSVINIPSFVSRLDTDRIIEIFDLKSLVKFVLYNREYSLPARLIHVSNYCLGFKKNDYIKQFNGDKDVNEFFKKNYSQFIGQELNDIWNYTEQTLERFQQLDKLYRLKELNPSIAIQIRGGDKKQEALELGKTTAIIDVYIAHLKDAINKVGTDNLSIYVMTDTFSYFQQVQEQILCVYPQVIVESLVQPNQEGYDQLKFNTIDKQEKIEAYYLFLYELERLRAAKICIGSYYSNIFYLSSLIRYQADHEFISVDAHFEDTFL